VRAVRDEYGERAAEQAGGVDLPARRLNLSITGAPAHLGELDAAGVSTVHAHADTSTRPFWIEIGSLPDADLTVTVDYDTAYALLVEQRPYAVLGAFLMGRIKITGDVNALTEEHGIDLAALPALLASLGVTGSSTLADLDPVAAELGDRIRDLTL
jgi:hypothetical protein